MIKLGSNVKPNKMSDKFETGSCEAKSKVTGSNLMKPIFNSKGCIYGSIFLNIGMFVLLIKFLEKYKIWIMWGQNLGQEVRSWENIVNTLKVTFLIQL